MQRRRLLLESSIANRHRVMTLLTTDSVRPFFRGHYVLLEKQQQHQQRLRYHLNNALFSTTTTTVLSAEQQGAAAAAAAAAATASTKMGIEEQTREAQQREQQRRAYEYYRKKSGNNTNTTNTNTKNIRLASYAAAAAVGALAATYASVPLYKIFCQATGFGGTTQRVSLDSTNNNNNTNNNKNNNSSSGISQTVWNKLIQASSNIPQSMLPQRQSDGTIINPAHNNNNNNNNSGNVRTWTDEDAATKLATLRPIESGRLITVRFDSTVSDIMPWSFHPTQLDVKVVPGETALSFFTATNHDPKKSITGVATYNVHPPRAGLYFQKIQCFCFEEQRLLPNETVDMPVFFFIDPAYANDPQLKRCNNITLSYTFFRTDEEEEEEEGEEEEEEES